MPIPIENNSWDYVQGLIEKEINSAFKLRIKEEDKMAGNRAINELYKMGFDGAAIEKLRHLTRKQYEELLTILNEFHKDKTITGR